MHTIRISKSSLLVENVLIEHKNSIMSSEKDANSILADLDSATIEINWNLEVK